MLRKQNITIDNIIKADLETLQEVNYAAGCVVDYAAGSAVGSAVGYLTRRLVDVAQHVIIRIKSKSLLAKQ